MAFANAGIHPLSVRKVELFQPKFLDYVRIYEALCTSPAWNWLKRWPVVEMPGIVSHLPEMCAAGISITSSLVFPRPYSA